MRFDAYAGSIQGPDAGQVAHSIARDLGGIVAAGRPQRRCPHTLQVDVDGRQAAWVGFDKANDAVYFEGKGETSPDLVGSIRSAFPEHTAARLDVCEDLEGEGVFDDLVALVRAHKGDRVKGGFVALPDDPEDGRTWAAGVRGGVAYMRIYEAGKMRERRALGRPHWVRPEWELRPHGARVKRAAARMSPLEVVGLTAWTQRVSSVISGLQVPRFEPDPRLYSHDKTTAYLARTFRRHWQEMLTDHGSWECIGRELQSIWNQDDLADS